MKIYQQVLRDPASFADLVTWGFKRNDGVSDVVADNGLVPGRGRAAHQVFSRLRRIPGQSEDGSLTPRYCVIGSTKSGGSARSGAGFP